MAKKLRLYAILYVVLIVIIIFYSQNTKKIFGKINFLGEIKSNGEVEKNAEKNNENLEQIKTYEDDNDDEDYLEETSDRVEQVIGKPIQKLNSKRDKWIILTTINLPTEHVKYLHDVFAFNSDDWNLLVLGDKKTPKDWSYKKTIFLSAQDQIILSEKYKIIKKIPFNSYLRKMVGYLYAIDKGAKYIYETDDDNSPLDGLFGFRYKSFKGLELNCLNTEISLNENLFINPYSYFGQPSVWPRGYPLERISNEELTKINQCKKYKIVSIDNEQDLPLIQQGLVNGDPDVDAIYRLTRKSYKSRLDIKFDEYAPSLVLNRNQYAPINSQNTFFHYNSFWTLIFPLDVTFRECDILRGYISIRLLQEINGKVAFIAPNAFQLRNSHSYHKDYLQEKRLYENIQSFVKDLNEWKCEKNSLQECFIECIQLLINKGHLNQVELEYYKDWINDLNNIGYQWPKINRQPLVNEQSVSVLYKAMEQEHSSNSNQNELSSSMQNYYKNQLNKLENICSKDLNMKFRLELPKLENVILITLVTNQNDFDYLTSFISIHFPYNVVCLSKNNDINQTLFNNYLNESFGYTIILNDDINFKRCINRAIKIGFKQQSFLIVKNINKFQFWTNENIQFLKTDQSTQITLSKDDDTDEGKLSENIYFLRRNVGNGLRYLKLSSNNINTNSSIKDFCKYFNGNKQNLVLNKFIKGIEALNWHTNDLPTESCENIDSKTVWIPDFHDGPRVDIMSTLVHLGQKPISGGFKKGNSPYPEALRLGQISDQISEYVYSYKSVTQKGLSESLVKKNYEFYKNSSDFQSVDIVICSFIASMCEAFIPLNKTIIFNPAHRYNIGRCNKESWSKLNSNYDKLKAKNKGIFTAMSKYDAEYQAHFSGHKDYRLYAYGGFYAKNIEFNPIRKEILVGPTNHMGPSGPKLLAELKEYSKPFNFVFNHIRELYPRYSLSQLANHRAIVLFPYAVMSYSIVDFYISNIPIFIPSIEILNKYKNVDDRSIHMSSYCGPFEDINPHNSTIHKFNPNDDSDDAYKYWLSYADYYSWPFVTVFDSWEDLINKLRTMDLNKISNNMKAYNKIKEADLLSSWCQIVKQVPNSQPIPNSYEEALKYFDIDRVQLL